MKIHSRRHGAYELAYFRVCLVLCSLLQIKICVIKLAASPEEAMLPLWEDIQAWHPGLIQALITIQKALRDYNIKPWPGIQV